MADKTLSLATDSMQLQVDGGITESDGIFSVPLTITRHMVQDYAGLKVLKPAAELEAAVPYIDKMPATRAHPESGIVTARDEVYGFITNPLFENDELRGILQTADKDFVADIKSKKLTGLSLGFFCNVERTPGTFGNAAYDAVQTNIFPNHVALLEGDFGRCSLADGCVIHMDAKPTPESTPDTSAALTKVTAERDALKADLEAIIKTEKDALIGELTSMQGAKTKEDLEKLRLDELKKELDMVKELRIDRLAFGNGHGNGGRSAINAAYAKVGR